MTSSNLTSTEVALSKRLRILCTDYENRPYVVKRGVLPTLVKFLSHENLLIAVNAAESLHVLSEHPDNPTPMCKENALLPALSKAYQTYSTMASNPSIRTEQPYDNAADDLQSVNTEASFSSTDPSSTPICAHLAELISKIVANLESSLEEVGSPETAQPSQITDETSMWMNDSHSHARIQSSVIHQTRSVVLDIPSLTEDTVNQLATLLETIRGIISFTIDFNRHVVRLLLTTPTPTFLRILDDHGFIAIILHEENVQQNNFHHITDENTPQYVSQGEYRRTRHGSSRKEGNNSLIPHGRRRSKHKKGKRHPSAHNDGQTLFGRISSWL